MYKDHKTVAQSIPSILDAQSIPSILDAQACEASANHVKLCLICPDKASTSSLSVSDTLTVS